ncbi:unnamed protein product [Polarella glacialis]|uniref:Subtilisin n=1 Tax=Polarella glacialis TaxID=89957 RepID=A0A813DES1_POLGL|nr:unnamed protein product [Polarella glacialis]
MVAFHSSSAAAVLGAVAFQAVSILLPRAASASWGWTQTVPMGANFACAEGTPIGCATADLSYGCNTSNVTCTVQPAAGYTCNETTIAVHCILPGGKAFLPFTVATDGGECKTESNNTLFWSAVPMCMMSTTAAPTATTKAASAIIVSGASQAAVPVMGLLSAMLVAGTRLQN